jgi:hypothetical protein
MTGRHPPHGGHQGGGPPPGPYGPYHRPPGPYGPPQNPYPPGHRPSGPSSLPPPGPPPGLPPPMPAPAPAPPAPPRPGRYGPPGPQAPQGPYGPPAPARQPYGRPGAEPPPPWERQLDQPPREQEPQPAGPPAGEPPDTGQAAPGERRRRLSPAARRLVEAGALLILLPVTLGLHWYDDDHTLGHQLRRDEHVTTVARGASATLGHATWRMIGRQQGGTGRLRSTTPGAEMLVLTLEMRPLDAQGVKDASGSGLAYRIRDREGHVWTGAAEVPEGLSAGRPVQVKVSAIVPTEKVTSVVLELLPTTVEVKPGTTVPVLRFAH